MRSSDGIRKLAEESSHLLRRFEVSLSVLKEAKACLSKRTPFADTGNNVLEGLSLRGVVVDVIRSNDRDAEGARGFKQCFNEVAV
jgi:hypothetical protein